MTTDTPSERVLLQRIRNQIIAHLEVTSSFDAQRRYQARVPFINVPAEVLCGWEDWVDDERLADYGPPVFTEPERSAAREYHACWSRVSDGMPQQLPALEEAIQHPLWSELREAAQRALETFSPRGRLPDDHEIPDS